eukprot:7760260-Lingulodinium_polyedra.AAC.1
MACWRIWTSPTIAFFFANVDWFDHRVEVADYPHMDIVLAGFSSRGHDIQRVICNSAQFGHAASLARARGRRVGRCKPSAR